MSRPSQVPGSRAVLRAMGAGLVVALAGIRSSSHEASLGCHPSHLTSLSLDCPPMKQR